MTRRQLFALGAARGAAIAVPAAALAASIAVALSSLTPIGLARELEPDPGFASTRSQSGWATAAVFVAVGLAGAYAASRAYASNRPLPSRRRPRHRTCARRGRVRALVAFPGNDCERCSVSRLARGQGATAVPVGATVLAGVLAVAVVAVALTFTASLHHLFSTPWLYGQNWDYRSNYAVPSSAACTSGPTRGSATLRAAVSQDHVLLNGRPVGVVAMDNIKGRIDRRRDPGAGARARRTRSCSRQRRSTRSVSTSATR